MIRGHSVSTLKDSTLRIKVADTPSVAPPEASPGKAEGAPKNTVRADPGMFLNIFCTNSRKACSKQCSAGQTTVKARKNGRIGASGSTCTWLSSDGRNDL